MTIVGRVAFSRVESVAFGEPSTLAVPAQVKQWGAERVLLIASRSLDDETSCVRELAASLGARCVDTVVGVPEHTPAGSVMELVARASQLEVDAIVTVGGGTIIDAAKAVRMCLANGVSAMSDFLGEGQPGGVTPLPPQVKQLSIPTTLSAAEFTGIAGVTDEATHVKALWRHPSIAPDSVVLDPQMTTHTPEWLFLSTGLRAVDHAVEGFCARTANPYTDAQAARGLELLLRGLVAVRKDPQDLEARLDCQLGAWMAMCPLACGVPMGASHGIGYVLGAGHGVPHGYTSCVMLPAVLRWNAKVNGVRQNEMARMCGSAGSLADLVGALGLPRTLADLDIGQEHDGDIAARSLSTPWLPHNPRSIEHAEQVIEILALAR